MKKLYKLPKTVSDYVCNVFAATKKELVGLIQWNKFNRDYEHTAEMVKLARDIKTDKLPVPIQIGLFNGVYTDLDGKGRLSNPDISDNETFLTHITEFKKARKYRAAMGMFNNSRKYHRSMKAFTEEEIFPFLDLIAKKMRPLFLFQNQTHQAPAVGTYNYDTLKRIVLAAYTNKPNCTKQAQAFAEIPQTVEFIDALCHHMSQYIHSTMSVDKDKRTEFLGTPALMAWASLFDSEKKTKNCDSWYKINQYTILTYLNKKADGKPRQALWSFIARKALNKPIIQKDLDILVAYNVAINPNDFKEVH